jgi:hypothetical protein
MSENQELFPSGEPRWGVLTRYRSQSKAEKLAKKPLEISHHDLLYGTHVESRRKGENGLEALREIARFLNRRNLKPRDRVECAADAPNPAHYLQKISGLR